MGLKAVSSLGGGSISGAQSVLGILPSYPAKLAKYRLALGNVRHGTSDMRILCVGDSTTMGVGTTLGNTLPNTGSWPTRLSQLINSAVTPAAGGIAIPPTIYAGNADNRWAVSGSTWIKTSFGAGAGACWSSAGPTGNCVFTPGVMADQYWCYYAGGPGGVVGTSMTFTATGGTAVTVNPSIVANGQYRVLVSAASASLTNTVTISAANGTANYIMGVEPCLSTKKQVLVGNAGLGGVTAAQWAALAGQAFYGPDFIKTVAPDLTIISLGINDASASIPATSVVANLQILITNALASGDVILMDMPPSNGSPYTTVEPAYTAAYQALATANNIIYASIYNRFGGVYSPSFMGDTLHPNDQGYWDWAQYIKELLGLN